MKQPPAPKRCRLTRTQLLRLLTPIAAFIPVAHAADVFKANNADNLDLTTSWVGGSLPTATDVAVFDSTVTGIPVDPESGWFLMKYPSAASWQGIRVNNAINDLAIDSFGFALPALTLGSAGIDLSAAASGTTFHMYGQAITLGAAQTWKVADGATLDISNATIARSTGVALKLELGATGTGVVKPNASFGAANAILGYATIDGGDFAAVNGTQTALVAGNTLGTYTPNPTTVPPTLAAGTYTLVDVINSGTGTASTALRIGGNITLPGIRFNTAHTGGLDWTVDGTGTTRNINIGNGGILVGPNVGAHNVIFNGSSWFRIGTADFYLHQFNTAGDLILNNSMSQASGSARTIKDGPGRVILTNSGNGFTGQTTIHEGTVQVGNGGTTGVINAGPVVNHGTLAYNRTDVWNETTPTWVVGNVISGTGTLQMLGTGTLALTGTNTYTGSTVVNAGAIAFNTAANLGTGQITLAGGGLLWRTGNTTDISSRTLTIGAGGATFNVGTNNVTFANSIGNSGAGGLTKTGTGTLTLAGANLYSGTTAVSAGGLSVTNTTGSATGSGAVTVANTAVLSGTGTISGGVSVAAGGKVVPGVGSVGTLTVGGLNLASGSLMDLEFSSLASHDQVVVTGADGLTLNGGSLQLNPTGTSNSLTTVGTYNIIQYSGNLNGTGANALSVVNPQPGYAYTFGTSGGFVTLSVALNAVLAQWIATGSGSWGSASNWSDSTAAGGGGDYIPAFTATLGSPATITLDGSRTVKGLSFDGTSGYTVAQGTGGSLTIDNGASSAGVTVAAGSHTISAPVVLNSTAGVSVTSGATLVISGAVSGSGGISKSGAGTLDLTGNNSFTGAVNVVGGTLGFGTANSLGTGALTLNGGALRYDSGNSADISSKVVTFGLNGATIDTNGNNVSFANPVGNSGSGSFTKTGLGSLTLAAANTYSGQTFVTGGTLRIASNASLGAEAAGAQLTLDNGILAPTATFALNNAGANSRAVAIGSNGAEINVGAGLTFTVSGVVSGTGSLLKSGTGDLTLSGLNSAFTGAVTIAAGTVRFGAVAANGQSGLGTGAITFGDAAHLYLNGQGTDNTNYGTLSNAISIPAGVTANIHAPQNGAYTGVVSGAGTLNLSVDGANFSVVGAWGAGFTGTLNLLKTPTGAGTETDDYCLNGTQDLSAAKVNVAAGVRMRQNFNPPSGTGTVTTHRYGELNAATGSVLGGNPVGNRYNIYSIGALNTDSTIDGQFVGIAGGFDFGYPLLTKEGTGTLTLNGTTHMMATPTAGTTPDRYSLRVNAGTLKVLGAVERFYQLAGADLTYGNADDTITQTLPTGDFRTIEPGPNLVAAAANGVGPGTLAGNGRLGGITTVMGNLRTDVTGSLGGQLTFTGAGTLSLDGSSTTTFDFGGTVFTGVKSEVSNGVTYGGTLKLNFLTSVYNGTYQLFELNGSPNGSFAAVTVTTTTTTDAALTDSGGTWTGTVDGASFSFNASTGVLTVTGGANAVLPATPGSVSATAGNAQVTLNWSAAANASSYLVKRSTTAGGPYATVTSSVVTTSYVDTGLTNGTTYYYVIQAKNSAGLSGNSAEVSATPQASTLTGLQNWRQTYFGTTDNLGNAADSADPDSDGIPNLIEYATNRNPTAANTSPVLDIGSSGGFLTVTYTSIDDDNLTYTVQGVNDIAGTPVWATVAQRTGAANIAGPVTITDTQAISASARRFLRLNVSYTP